MTEPSNGFEFGKLKCKSNNFWISLMFLIAFVICFITYCICSTIKDVSKNYLDNKSTTSNVELIDK